MQDKHCNKRTNYDSYVILIFFCQGNNLTIWVALAYRSSKMQIRSTCVGQ